MIGIILVVVIVVLLILFAVSANSRRDNEDVALLHEEKIKEALRILQNKDENK